MKAGEYGNRLAVVIPVYNHGSRVAGVVTAAKALNVPVFVVDDGSMDETPERIIEIPGITVLRHSENQGKGAALLTGFASAAAVADWAATVDADGQHDPQDVLKLWSAVVQPSKKSGSRWIPSGQGRQSRAGETPATALDRRSAQRDDGAGRSLDKPVWSFLFQFLGATGRGAGDSGYPERHAALPST